MHGNRITGLVAIILIVGAIAAVYGRGLDNGFVYDDQQLIVSNPALRDPGPLARYLTTPLFEGTRRSDEGVWAGGGVEYWRPFVKLALLIQYRLFGDRALGYHAVGIAVHLLSTLLLFSWLSRRLAPVALREPARLVAMPSDSAAMLAAGLGAAIFALHPARVESVIWVSGCMDLWMVFFVLVGLVFWDRAGRGSTVAAVVAFTLAALAKETAVVVPVCLGVDAWARGAFDRAMRRRLWAPAVAMIAFVLAWFALVPPAPGAMQFGGIARVLTSAGLFAGRILWPYPPSTQVGPIGADGRFAEGGATLATGVVVVVAIAAFVVLAVRRPRWRAWAGEIAWIVLPLLPVANLIAIGYSSLVAERFLALPMIGVAALAARAVVRVPRPTRKWVVAAQAAAVVGFAWIASAYVPRLRDEATLWRYETQIHPTSPNLYLSLARAETAAGRLPAAAEAARAAYARAETRDMKAWAALAWAATRLQTLSDTDQDALVSLRQFYDDLIDQGRAELVAADERWDVHPTVTGLEIMRGASGLRNARIVTHARTSSFAVAERLLQESLRDHPTPTVAANWVRILGLQLRWTDAAAALTTALQAYPSDPVLVKLVQLLRNAEYWVGDGASDPLRTETARALLWLYFGSIPRAQASLGPVQERFPDSIEVTVLVKLIEAAQGRVHESREFFLNQRLVDPHNMGAHEWALGQILLVTEPNLPPVVSPAVEPSR